MLAIAADNLNVGRADTAKLIQRQAGVVLRAAAAQCVENVAVAGVAAAVADQRQIAELRRAHGMLSADAEAVAVVLIAPVVLRTLFSGQLALRQRAVNHAKRAQFELRAAAAHHQRFRRLGVGLQRQPVAHAVAIRAAGGGAAVIEVFHAVVFPQRTRRKREIAKARLQQIAGDIKGQRGGDLATHRIGSDNYRIARAVNKRQVGQRPGARLHVVAAGTIAVNEQVDGGGHGRLTGKGGQRIGHQIGAHAEVAAKGYAAQPYAAAPGEAVADQIADAPAQRAVLILVGPKRVVADIAILLRRTAAGQRLLINTVAGKLSRRAKQPQLTEQRQP